MNTATAVVDNFRARGITVRVVAGRLEVRPASALTEHDRAAIRRHAAELVSQSIPQALPDEHVWNWGDAVRQMYDADTLVDQLGVSGCHPKVQDAAARVGDAFTAGDTNAFRSALAAFTATVRRVAGECGRAGDKLLQQTRR